MLYLTSERVDETALPENAAITYLGTWVLPEEDLCNQKKKEIINYCYDDHDKLFLDFIYIKSLYNSILPIIGQLLNEHHSLNWDSRSFKIFYGAWLHEYLPVIRERYQTIEMASQAKPSHSFILTDCNITLLDSEDFKKKISTDEYNHYLYSKIVKFIDHQTYDNSYFFSKMGKQGTKRRNIKRLVKSTLKIFLLKNLQLIFNIFTRGAIAAVDRSYFSKIHFWQLIINSFPRITPIFHLPILRPLGIKQELGVRDKLHKVFNRQFSPRTEFEKFILQNLIYDMPLSFIESFKDVLLMSTHVNLTNKNYLSSNAILGNQILQCAAANQMPSNRNLIIAQHGGAYGIAKWSMQEFYELDTADRYISFGWAREKLTSISKISHPKLLLKNRAKRVRGFNVLYITCAPSRYFNRNWSFPIAGNSIIDYYKNILVLLSALKPHLRKHISVRLAPSDSEYKVGVKFFLGGKIKLSKGNFYQELNAASLVICDHNQTTLIESFSSNKPTIIVWNPDYTRVDKAAEPIFEDLARLGIFYSCHKKAAEFLNKILDEDAINEWWEVPARQDVVASFVKGYCKRNEQWISDYQKILKIDK